MKLGRNELRAVIEHGIPFLQKVRVVVDEAGQGRATLRFPYDRANDNYLGTAHAGAIFTFGETCAGVAAGTAFDLQRLRMVARRAEITYRRPVTGELRGVAVVDRQTVGSAEAALARGGKATFTVAVGMENAAGEEVAEMTVDYDLRRAR